MGFDRNIKVSELMTKEVITVYPSENLAKVAEVFSEHSFHHIPVIGLSNEVMGIVSRSDFNKMQNTFTIFDLDSAKRKNETVFKAIYVSDIIPKNTVVLKATDTAQMAMGIFRENRFHALPVVDDENKLLGILTTYDLLTYAYLEPAYS